MKIILPHPSEVVNPSFAPLFDNQDRYLLVWGGRGSSKSVSMATKLIYRCLEEHYFKYIITRKVRDTIKDSIYAEIKENIIDLGLERFFTFKTSPLEIICKNGNQFIFRGLDEPMKIKSIKEPTGALHEEGSQMTLEDFNYVTTSIRTQKANYLQEIILFNPETYGDYHDFWLYKMFFEGRTENSFRDKVTVKVDNEDLTYWFTSHHSTYRDNQYISKDFIAFLENLKITDPYYYDVWCLGNWGNKSVEGRFYKHWHPKHIGQYSHLYNPDIPLHISFDFNVLPYVTLVIHQIQGKKLIQLDEFCMKPPANNTLRTCQEFKKSIYKNHKAKIKIYGDYSGKNKKTSGQNDFDIVFSELSKFNIEDCVKPNPSVSLRGDFVNELFLGFEDFELLIDEKCVLSIADYNNVREASDGSKLKKKITKDGVSWEPYGHTSDANDYIFCEALKDEFKRFIGRGKKSSPVIVRREGNNMMY